MLIKSSRTETIERTTNWEVEYVVVEKIEKKKQQQIYFRASCSSRREEVAKMNLQYINII